MVFIWCVQTTIKNQQIIVCSGCFFLWLNFKTCIVSTMLRNSVHWWIFSNFFLAVNGRMIRTDSAKMSKTWRSLLKRILSPRIAHSKLYRNCESIIKQRWCKKIYISNGCYDHFCLLFICDLWSGRRTKCEKKYGHLLV